MSIHVKSRNEAVAELTFPSNAIPINSAGLGGGGCYKSTRDIYLTAARSDLGAGLGGGGCYEDFRDENSPRADLELGKCDVQVDIHDNHRFNSYSIEYELSVISNSQADWTYLVPFSANTISDIWAKDSEGGLAWKAETVNGSKTLIRITFRKPINEGEKIEFSLGYTTKNVSLTRKDMFSETTSYTDWIIHNCPTKRLTINVNLPGNSTALDSLPPADLNKLPVAFDEDELRPLEHWHIVVLYKTKRVTSRLYKNLAIWTVLAVVAGLLGNNADRMATAAIAPFVSSTESAQ